jgi:hypothetical protein
MSRALKFHHRDRLKRNRRFYLGIDMLSESKYLSMVVNTPAPCSCPMCGNNRRYEGKSINEKRFDEFSKYQEFEISLKSA